MKAKKKKKSKIESKQKISGITLILIVTISALIVTFPLVSAHEPSWNIPTYAFLTVNPNPAGVEQTLTINMWLNRVPPTAVQEWGDRWEEFTINIIKPDGTDEILGPFSSDSTGATWITYTPTMVGDYSFTFDFPGQILEGKNPPAIARGTEFIGDYFEPSTSDTVVVTIQEEPAAYIYSNPSPSGYWERPISGMNTDWFKFSGNWFGLRSIFGASTGQYDATSNFNPYTKAPNTAHIVWTKPFAAGGLMGGEYGDTEQSSFYSTAQYEQRFAPIIMNGILYYTSYPSASSNPAGWIAIDIRTGETLWTKDTTAVLICGQILDFTSPNQYGGIPYLWARSGSDFMLFDAYSGNWILNMTNAVVGSVFGGVYDLDSNGNLLLYYKDNAHSTLNMWNSTKAIQSTNPPTDAGWSWRPPQGAQIPWEAGLEWTVDIPTTIEQADGTDVTIAPTLALTIGASVLVDDVLLLNNMGNGAWQPGWTAEAGYSAIDGELLWGPINRTQPPHTSLITGASGDGVYTVYNREARTWSGYSVTTGEKIWGPTESSTDAFAYYNWWSSIFAYGNLYSWTLGGHVNCYDIKTGEHLWHWETGSSAYESPYGTWPLWVFSDGSVADGKIYIGGGHEYSPPLFKGAKIYCLNATTGEEIFETLNFAINGPPAIADDFMLVGNAYDNQVYVYGKGPSKTTVNAPDIAVSQGSSVIIRGTVTDESPGTKSTLLTALCPNGVPVVSNEDQSTWMEYLYQQQPKPEDVTGVEVYIKIQDPNGDWYDTRVMTDKNGMFSHMWAPSIVGEYHVTAIFEGSGSYYASESTTSFGVDPTPPTGTLIEPETPVHNDPLDNQEPTGFIINTEIVIIAAVSVAAVICIAAYWILKRK